MFLGFVLFELLAVVIGTFFVRKLIRRTGKTSSVHRLNILSASIVTALVLILQIVLFGFVLDLFLVISLGIVFSFLLLVLEIASKGSKKKRIAYSIIACIIGIGLLSGLSMFGMIVLSSADETLYTMIGSKGIHAAPSTKDACIAKGGDWGKWGMLGNEFCQIPASDAEKTCYSGFQCTYGRCVKRGFDASFLEPGKCMKYQHSFGCYSEFHFGINTGGMCID